MLQPPTNSHHQDDITFLGSPQTFISQSYWEEKFFPWHNTQSAYTTEN